MVDIPPGSGSWADPGIEFGDTGVGVVISFDREDNVEFRAYAATSYPGVRQVIEEALEEFASRRDPLLRKLFEDCFRDLPRRSSRRYPDGSGEPPGADIIELGKSNKNLDYPLIDALKAAIEVRISRYLDAGAEV